MLTDEELRTAYSKTNKLKHDEGWLGLERFAREIECLVEAKRTPPTLNHNYPGKHCTECGKWQTLANLVLKGKQWLCKHH